MACVPWVVRWLACSAGVESRWKGECGRNPDLLLRSYGPALAARQRRSFYKAVIAALSLIDDEGEIAESGFRSASRIFVVTGCRTKEEAEMCPGLPPVGSSWQDENGLISCLAAAKVEAFPTDDPFVWRVEVRYESPPRNG